jgi:hypothetical protein
MKLIYENMSVDEFMIRYNYMVNKEWYDETLKRPLLVDTNEDFDDPIKLITNNDFMMILHSFESEALDYITSIFGKIDIPLIGSFDFGDLVDTFCDTFNGIRMTIEKIYLEDEIEKLYNMIDSSSDGVAYYDGRYFKYV